MKTLMAATVAGALMFASGVAAGANADDKPADKTLTLKLADGVEMEFAPIPAGKFTMGSPEGENGPFNNETQHEVSISRPFYMGKTHVTVDQFAVFVKDTGYKTDAEKDGCSWSIIEMKDRGLRVKKADGVSWRKPSFDQKGDHPVVQVSWNDAVAFCDWLSKKSGKPVRLPTEAEWEYACRAGTKTAYPWGDSPDDGKGWANCADQALKKAMHNGPDLSDGRFFNWDDGFMFTSPAGSFKANAFGLYDMVGNALQWCADRYGTYENGAATDPEGPAVAEHHVLRGGGWFYGATYCRSAARWGDGPGAHGISFGFRVAVSANED